MVLRIVGFSPPSATKSHKEFLLVHPTFCLFLPTFQWLLQLEEVSGNLGRGKIVSMETVGRFKLAPT